ncbi:MAG: hypothetical protein J6N21_17530 [Butyrivibrio sp.]|nr:hypothetical protein [Butyrivibrio sp.]MBP3198785.1 hypothetical protein [Butyrivibrio sp.]
MEQKLSRLFDFQKYAGNKAMQSIIDDVESRYHIDAVELSDDELFGVAAAGVSSDINAAKNNPEWNK